LLVPRPRGTGGHGRARRPARPAGPPRHPLLRAAAHIEGGKRGRAGTRAPLEHLSPANPEGPRDLKGARQRPTLPPGYPGSTIGAGGLNFRVRKGNGCLPSAIVTERRRLYRAPRGGVYGFTPASVTVAVWVPPWLTQVTDTSSPALCDLIALPSVSEEVTVDPPILVITELRVIPALSAGEPVETLVTSAPDVTLKPSACAFNASRVWTETPRKPTWP